MVKNELTKEIITQALFRMRENTPRVKQCLEELHDEQVWHKPNDVSNSVGNLILHLCGNIRQYIISSLGKTDDLRDRDTEFSASNAFNKNELYDKLSETVNEANSILSRLSDKDLIEVKSVQGFEFSGIGIIMHVVEHYSYHTGQIVFWTKELVNKDLGFYSNLDLNKKNGSTDLI